MKKLKPQQFFRCKFFKHVNIEKKRIPFASEANASDKLMTNKKKAE